ncbi:cytochrome P450 [Ceraceosorus guamensis]|uniref:Cytochrome P450 n=1 Tax=Ceraceosorus guamensis TaxID=1522189 RepID=A0A316VRI8_9BASI|nr:cytochrome P450 [Ceraceosorus guamensis]PWN40216.1 cytochrome P450 [Ceraceosorus guamensis]
MTKTDVLPFFSRAVSWMLEGPSHVLLSLTCALIAWYALDFLSRPQYFGIPGPFLAKFSDLWLTRQAMRGDRWRVVDDLHRRYGKVVRLAPNHISIADADALNPIYGHSTGTLKEERFYSGFVPPAPAVRGLFNTTNRAEHTRKRKAVSHAFSPKQIVSFEHFIRKDVQLLLDRWDEFCKAAEEKQTEGPRGLKGYAWLDSLEWMNFFAFDTIGDLAFGSTFGMLESGKDVAMAEVEDANGNKETKKCSAVETINLRGEVSATIGLVPYWLRPLTLRLPWFAKRLQAVRTLTGIALARVNDRLVNGSERDDLLAALQSAKDEKGEQMEKRELTAEALTQLIAGSDTTSNTSCAILYHLGSTPDALKKLQVELDKELVNAEDVPLMSDVDRLPYLQGVLNESMRTHGTSSIGLPRVLPAQGAVIAGHFFPGGSVLSVPTYTIHHDASVWGADARQYRPDRWLDANYKKKTEKAFNPFSVGPRACVGRNVALAELSILIAALIHRYDFVLEEPEKFFQTREGFLKKPVELRIGIKRRGSARAS